MVVSGEAVCRHYGFPSPQFPGMLTFREFLQQTRWEDPARTFEDGFDFGLSAEAASPAGKAQGAQP